MAKPYPNPPSTSRAHRWCSSPGGCSGRASASTSSTSRCRTRPNRESIKTFWSYASTISRSTKMLSSSRQRWAAALRLRSRLSCVSKLKSGNFQP